jgi:predicted DNA-binding transcriptional regulator AlpA
MDKLLKPHELANELSVPLSWVYSRSRQKGPDTIPMVKCGRYCRFSLSAVLEWLKEKNPQNESSL